MKNKNMNMIQYDIAGNSIEHRIITRTEPLASLTIQIILVFDKNIWSPIFFISTLHFIKHTNTNYPKKQLNMKQDYLLYCIFLIKFDSLLELKAIKLKKVNLIIVSYTLYSVDYVFLDLYFSLFFRHIRFYGS